MSPSLGSSHEVYDVVVLGAGYAGMMAALRVGRRRLGLRVALVNSDEQFVERVRLQESMVAPVKLGGRLFIEPISAPLVH